MDGLALLREASAAGLRVEADGGKLIVRGPRTAEPIALRVIAAKSMVLEALRWALATPSPEIPVAWREGREQMRVMIRPTAIPLARWIALSEAADVFLAGQWAARAVALGWCTLDVFGAHRVAPDARVDCHGLLWSLAFGNELTALADDTAALRTRSGSVLRARRRLIPDPEAVPIWHLRNAE